MDVQNSFVQTGFVPEGYLQVENGGSGEGVSGVEGAELNVNKVVMDRKLDLSRLTDDEAKHVWDVIQRDFNLRKKEEERLGDLKTKIEKEDTKRELLTVQSKLSACVCVCCLQPFKFLLNSKRLCLDCHMFTCKTCSRYNKKEHGWVCDNCRMTRVLKIGTAGWYHDNVRNRFKRFGSAKVMRSLYKRLNGEGGRDDDTQSMPDVRNYMYNANEDEHGDVEAQRYKGMRKSKRLLSVHPLDFDPEEYSSHSRRASIQMQEDRFYRNDVDYDVYTQRMNRRKSLDRYAMRPEEYVDSRMVRTRSLSKISSSVARQQYVDTSDEDEFPRYPLVYQPPPLPPHRRRNSRTSSQENLGQAPPINELNKRMLAIESLLSRLEEKMTPGDEALTPSAQNEEEKLRRKLSELAGNLSDKGVSSEDEGGKKTSVDKGPGPVVTLDSLKDKELSSSSDEVPTEAQKVYVTAGQSYELESKLRKLEQNARNRFGGTTDSELSELEDVVALTAARVQSAESEVSDIESKLAALSAAGSKKKVSVSQRKKSTQDLLKTNGAQWKNNMY
ncbi:melanophilin-like isoform X2 [Solea senegalensis]|uniref:Melanophilin-like isoform X2 n=1 Tax=Solea senegalensis TaxID=28829 RepID=A0AAV6PQY4_SOLSE|nr:melanophilin-like isoform X2 [Solea senegalensis]